MRKLVYIMMAFGLLISCDDIVEVEDISNSTVTILAPTDNAELNQTTLMFSWESVEDAETYKLQIATPSFLEALQIVEDTTVTTQHFSKTLDYGTYEWRVRAENSSYHTAYTTHQFSIVE